MEFSDIRDGLTYRIIERLASAPFHLIATADGGNRIVFGYRPTLLIDALWQQLAREAAGIIHHPLCPPPRAELRALVAPQPLQQRPPVLLSGMPDAGVEMQ